MALGSTQGPEDLVARNDPANPGYIDSSGGVLPPGAMRLTWYRRGVVRWFQKSLSARFLVARASSRSAQLLALAPGGPLVAETCEGSRRSATSPHLILSYWFY